MPNIKENINCHNKSTLQSRMNMNEPQKLCNCRKPFDCSMNGHCLRKSIVYQATAVSIKHGLRTADHGLRTGYKIRTKYKMRTLD